MEALSAVLERIRCRTGRPADVAPVDDDFDDDYSSSGEDEDPPLEDVAAVRSLDVSDTLAAVLHAARQKGLTEAALAFLEFAGARAGTRPSWRALGEAGECEALPSRPLAYELVLRDPLGEARALRVSDEAFTHLLAVVYYATFRLPDADVYACGKAEAELMRNYELAKRCALRV